jgi:hypothetical protein
LQAEAATPDSALYHRRERVLDDLVALGQAQLSAALGAHVHPFVFRTLFLGLEGIVLHARREGRFEDAARREVEGVVKALFLQVLAGASSLPGSSADRGGA